MRRRPVPAFAAAALVIAALAVHGTVDESDEKWMEVLRKTPRQLEDMLLEFGVDAATLTSPSPSPASWTTSAAATAC